MQTSSFEYNDQGHKIHEIRILWPEVKSESPVLVSTAVSFSVLEQDDPYVPIPAGGHAKTLFNESDQPVEWQISDANGNLLNRLIRTYDENGRPSELRYTYENTLLTLPAESRQQLMAEPRAAEELAKQFAEFFGEERNFMRTTYAYDADGRLTEKHTHMGLPWKRLRKSLTTIIAINLKSTQLQSVSQTLPTMGNPVKSHQARPPIRKNPKRTIPTSTIRLAIGPSRRSVHPPTPTM